MILYVQNSKDAIRNFLGAINEFGKVTGYKINTQKSLASLDKFIHSCFIPFEAVVNGIVS